MRDLSRLDDAELATLSEEYAGGDSVTIDGVRLPLGCSPPGGPLTFLKAEGSRCEVYLSKQVGYRGDDLFWRGVFAAQPLGDIAYLSIVASSFGAALQVTARMIGRTHSSDITQVTDLPAVVALRVEARAQRSDIVPEQLADVVRRGVRGQDQALQTVSERVAYHLARSVPRRPLSLCLIGQTGVGKTRTVELLAGALDSLADGDVQHGELLRLDMGEYTEGASVARLLGASPGYVGYADGAVLVDALRDAERRIVLFDEIEKAHPDVLRVLLAAMDAGRLSSAKAGGVVTCAKAIFCFTSNLASEVVQRDLLRSQGYDDQATIDAVCREALQGAGLAPELVGRISACVYYRPLGPETEAEVATLAILAAGREFELDVVHIAPEVIVAVLQHTRAGGLGARPVEYAAEALLAPAFAQAAARFKGEPVVLTGSGPFECEPIGCAVSDRAEAAE